MSFITKNVDKVEVNYVTKFMYTIDASFSSVEGDILEANIVDYIPDYIQYQVINLPAGVTLTEVHDPILQNTKLTFNFGDIVETGVAYQFNIICNFLAGTDNGEQFENIATLYQKDDKGNEETIDANAPIVTLKIVPKWDIEKVMLSPANNNPTQGGYAYYLLSLRNLGDQGAVLKNFSVVDQIPSEMIIDPSFTPQGINNGGGIVVPDPVNPIVIDNITNTVTWNFVSYSGNNYSMIIKVIVKPNVEVGTIVTNTANLIYDGEIKDSVNYKSTISPSKSQTGLSKYGPLHSEAGAQINYEISLANTGNQDLVNVELVEKIPPEVIIEKVFPGNYGRRGLNQPFPGTFTISYSIDNGATYDLLGTYNYGNNPYWTYTNVPAGTTNLKWFFDNYPIDFVDYNGPRLDGIVKNDVEVDDVAINIVELYLTPSTTPFSTAQVKTLLDGVAQLNGAKLNHPSSAVIPGDIIRYEAQYYSWASPVNEPIVLDLLPSEVLYNGNVTINYSDYFNEFTFINIPVVQVLPNPITSPVAIVEVIEDYNGTGKTAIRISIKGFTLPQRSNLYVGYDTIVKPGVRNTITNNLFIANYGESIANPGYTDVDDLDDDGITDEQLLISNNVYNNVLFSASYATDKKVKGSLDTIYTEEPAVGNTYDGGRADYKLTFTNTGNATFTAFEIVDILPHVGDVGVITGQPRKSQFPVALGDTITATLVPEYPLDPVPVITIEYSKSYNPQRFSKSGGIIPGDNDWTVIPPDIITEVKSFKIIVANATIRPGQSVIIDVKGVSPIGAQPGEVAWNSYALRGSFTDWQGNPNALLPVEPEKVGIQILPVDSGKVKLGDFVWLDINKNGIWDNNEPGINGVQVNLYNSNYNPLDPDASLVATTTTANDTNGNPGNYIFNNLTPGKYFIKFIPPNGYNLTIQRAELPNGSKPNQTTGLTNIITTVQIPGTEDLTIDAGIYEAPILATVGDLVWVDTNEDGIYDPNTEVGQPGVVVQLYTCDGRPTEYSDITDENGNYLITGVLPGDYYAVFRNIPQNYVFITAKDYVTVTGLTPKCFTVNSGDTIDNIDAPININLTPGPPGPPGESCTCENINLECHNPQEVKIRCPINISNHCTSESTSCSLYVNCNNQINLGYGTYLVNYSLNAAYLAQPSAKDYIAIQLEFNNKLIAQGFGYRKDNGNVSGTALIQTTSFFDNTLSFINVGNTDIIVDDFEITIVKV